MGEYDRIWSMVGNRQIEELADLPLLTDPDVSDMLDVFTEIVHPAMFYDENLSSLAVCRMVNLSLEYGNCDGSCFGYVWFAMFAGPRFNNYKDGFRFGQLGYDLVEKRKLSAPSSEDVYHLQHRSCHGRNMQRTHVNSCAARMTSPVRRET